MSASDKQGGFHMKWTGFAWLFLALATTAHAQGLYGVQPQTLGIPSSYDPSFHRATGLIATNAPPGQLKEVLASLAHRAEAGETLAAKAIFMGLAQCEAAKAHNAEDTFQAHCIGLTQSDYAQTGKWLAQAAQAGDDEAQYIYAQSAHTYVLGPDADKDPAALASFKTTARSYLLALAEKCNIDATYAIANDAAGSGFLYGDDLADGYKFAVVSETIVRPDAGHAMLAGGIKRLQDKIANKMGGTAGLAPLRRDASVFVDRYCR
jgi:hypothetical protein